MKILITGATGNLGSYIIKDLKDKHDLFLTDIRSPHEKQKNFKSANLADFSSIKKLCRGVDVVIHLGASSHKESPWEELLPNNIIATRNVFEAAAQMGCKRIIFASSINTVNGYPQGKPLSENITPKPPNEYGVSKVFGEALASYYADKKNISVLCIRFGRIMSTNDQALYGEDASGKPLVFLDRVIFYQDAAQLIRRCIAAPQKITFGIFSGISNNTKKRLDLSFTKKVLNYKPEYNSFKVAKDNLRALTKKPRPLKSKSLE
jgi:nucleoside-diphosphate-sugar epimerase